MTDDLFEPPHIRPPERQLPYFRALHAMIDNPMEGWPRAVYEQMVYVPPRRDFRTVYICDPHLLRRVFVDDVANFSKSHISGRLLRPLLGRGLLTAEGDHWRWQRQAAAPAFQPRRIHGASPVIASATENMIERWAAKDGGRLDMQTEMVRLTFDVILETMLGGAGEHDVAEMSRNIAVYLHHLGTPGVTDLFGAPTWLRSVTAPRGVAAIRYLQNAVMAMVARRRAAPPVGDLVDMLMSGRDPTTQRAMSDIELRDNILTFMTGGHETTALTLTWSLFLVASHPETQARIRAEVDGVCADRPIAAADASRLRFTRQVIEEAIRLYPPVPVLTRVCNAPCRLGAHDIAKGDIVVAPIYAMHRHRAHWDNPNAFDPDRFADRSVDRRFVYMPFGGGPRICIGSAFAMMEATIVLASIVRACSLHRDPSAPVRPLLRITLRPEGGMPVDVSLRPAGRLQRRARADSARIAAPA